MERGESPMSQFISLFLSARPSLLEGIARLFDFGGTLNEYNKSLTPTQADSMALCADIEALRQDVAIVKTRLRQRDHVKA